MSEYEKFLLDNFTALPGVLWNKSLANVIKDEWSVWSKEYRKSKNYTCDYSGYHCKSYTLECHEQYIIDTDNKRIIINNVLCLFYPFHKMHHLGYFLTVYDERKENGKEFVIKVINQYHHTNINFDTIDKEFLHRLLYDNFKDVKVLECGKIKEFRWNYMLDGVLSEYKYDVSMLPNNQILKDGLRKKNLLYEEVK